MSIQLCIMLVYVIHTYVITNIRSDDKLLILVSGVSFFILARSLEDQVGR
jgi:hypothetical protein